MKTAGASGGPIRQALIPGRFLTGRWLMNREAGVMEQWSIGRARIATRSVAGRTVGVLEVGLPRLPRIASRWSRGWGSSQGVRMQLCTSHGRQ
jgi:hypothetical protein